MVTFLSLFLYFLVHNGLIDAEEGKLAGSQQLSVFPLNIHHHQRGSIAPVAHSRRGRHRSLRLVAQEMEGAGLGHMVAAVRMDGKAGGIVRHGINGAAVDHAVGVLALRPDVQPEHRLILLHRYHFNMIIHSELVARFFFPHACSEIFHLSEPRI